jgi:hypothetical protein
LKTCETKEAAMNRYLANLPRPSNNMKKSLALLSAVLLSAFVQISQAQPIPAQFTINISSYNGGAESLIDWSFTGDFTNSAQFSSWNGGYRWFAAGGTSMWNDTVSSPTNPVSGGGVFNVLSGTTVPGQVRTASIQSVQFYQSGANQAVILAFTNSGNVLFGNSNVTFNYTPGIDSYVLPIAFDSFNTGVYTNLLISTPTPEPYGNGLTIDYLTAVNIGAVPEPSTYALLLLSGATSLWALKRRKS